MTSANLSPDLSLERLRADIATILEVTPADIADDANLIDIGLDSMRTMNLVLAWEEAGIPIDFPDLAEVTTLSGLWQIASERAGAS